MTDSPENVIREALMSSKLTLNELTAERDSLSGSLDEWMADFRELKAEIDRLRKAIEQHECIKHFTASDGGPAMTTDRSDLDAALAEDEAETPERCPTCRVARTAVMQDGYSCPDDYHHTSSPPETPERCPECGGLVNKPPLCRHTWHTSPPPETKR